MKNWHLHLLTLLTVTAIPFHSIYPQRKAVYVKLYNHLPLFDAPVLLGVEETADNRIISLSSLGMAIHLDYEDEFYKEFELSRISATNIDDGTAFIETRTGSFRYEYGKNLPRKYNSIKIRLGGSARYYFGRRVIDDAFESVFQRSNGLILSATSHIDWRVYKKLYFELAPTVQLVNGSFRLENNDNQILTPEESSAVDFFFQPFQLLLRFGFSWRLK